jgi:asparagine synthase (glutamine-hydrolysing)
MCGIAVILNTDGRPVERPALERMMAAQVHRGPDQGSAYVEGQVGMGFRRLAILDLTETGHQPMVSEDGGYVLVFNGEIFNYQELREELTSFGYTFRSSGDSEVLLNSYRHWGRDCLRRFNGMWSFIIYDRRRGHLFGARDRFGVKPFYYAVTEEGVTFASEIKAIRAANNASPSLNWRTVAKFLLAGQLDTTSSSFYEGVEQIEPGSAFELSLSGHWTRWIYWTLDQLPRMDISDPASKFAELFENAVKIRMRSDVPVGVSLSGGLDSTAIICAAARHREDYRSVGTEPLLAFCYMAKEYDESRYIADTLAQTKAQLKQLQTSPVELWSLLQKVLWFQDEPVHTMTPVVGYQLMGLAAANGIRVVLNGQGADETIGGYFSYFLDAWLSAIRRGRIWEAYEAMRSYVRVHGGSVRQFLPTLGIRLIAWELYRLERYRRYVRRRNRERMVQNPWYTAELTQYLAEEDYPTADGTLDAALRQSVRVAPLPLYLRIEDRNSMAHSIEARLPFMDYRLVTLLFNLPDSWKVRGPWNKYVLREGMRGRIPESVRSRADKMGFPTAGAKWFAHDLYEPVRDLLASRAFRERGIYHPRAIETDLDHHRRGDIDASQRLFHVVELELLCALLNQNPGRQPA